MIEARKTRLAYFVSHPIQYQAPLLRYIAAQPDIDLTVYFTNDYSLRGFVDEGFLINVEWDIPLLGGYRHEFLPIRYFQNAHPDYRISSGIRQRLRREKFDAAWIHGYHTFDAIHAILACRSLDVPILMRAESHLDAQARSPFVAPLKSAYLGALLRTISGVLSIGKLNREYWEHFAGESFPIFDMPYAVDNNFFQERARKAAASREQLREELGLAPGGPILLFASKLQERKRCVDLIEAYLKIKSSPEMRSSSLLIIGDGEKRAELEQRLASHPNIRMLGFRNQSELPRFFDLCDLFILPSIHEPWGLVVNEVMNAGRAVIVSDQVGCQPDLVQDGVNGCVFKALDVDSLAAALRRAAVSSDRLAQMGRESLRIIERYSFAQDVTGLREALQTVSRQQNAGRLKRTARISRAEEEVSS